MSSVLGLGLDIVDVPGFAAQLDDAASGFVNAVFTPAELRGSPAGAELRARHLAGCFAAKEAFVKAWAGARRGHPPALADLALTDIEVRPDAWGRPGLCLYGEVRAALAGLGPVSTLLSISHDGPTAAAVVVVSGSD